MQGGNAQLIIPVENQIRELDPKLLLAYVAAAQNSPLACERIVGVIEKIVAGRQKLPKRSLDDRLLGWSGTIKRRIKKRLKEHLPGYSHNSPEFQRHRYPGISSNRIREKLSRFSQLLGERWPAEVKQIHDQFFLIY